MPKPSSNQENKEREQIERHEEGKPQKPKYPHAGHRSRIRKRFRETGLAGFQDYEILEYLLFSSCPQQDTQRRARNIIAQCGSLAALFAAPPAARRAYSSMTENTALQIEFITALYQKLVTSQAQHLTFDQPSIACSYFQQLYAFESTEALRVATFSEHLKLLNCHTLDYGTSNAATLNLRKLVEVAILDQSSNIMLIHQHPEQFADFSPADYNTTHDIIEYLMPLSIRLYDHILIGRSRAVSMRQQGHLFDSELNFI